MRTLVLLLALAAPLALAQHNHGASAPVIDANGKPAVTAPEKDESLDHAKHHALPVGKGALADGRAWLRIDVAGCYKVHNAEVTGWINGAGCSDANRVWWVQAHKGALIWTPPGGKMGPVPAENLIAPRPDQVAKPRK